MGEFIEVGHRTNPPRRTIWTNLAKGLTFLVPGPLLRALGYKTQDAINAWREKTALCLFLLISSVFFLFLVEGLPRIICTKQSPYTHQKLKATSLVAVHGKIVDFGSSNSEAAQFARKNPGLDISSAFPRYSFLARLPNNLTYPTATLNSCIKDPLTADAWLASALKGPGFKVDNRRLAGCPNPADPDSGASVPCFYSPAALDEVKQRTIAELVYERKEIAPKKLVSLGDRVYNLDAFLSPSLTPQRALNESELLFPRRVTDLLKNSINPAGAQRLLADKEWSTYQSCLELLFSKGNVRHTPRAGVDTDCAFWSFPLFLCLVPIAVLLFKMFLAFRLARGTPLTPSGNSPCILLIPCFNETKEEIESCISSAVETNYIDHNKLLVIICDGVLCLSPVLEVLGHQGAISEAKSYQSVGVGGKAANCAQVFSGYHYYGSHGVPFVVIAKTGNGSETGELVGNRGKRDSLLVLLNFLDGVSSPDNLLTPLEAELLERIQNLDLDPLNFSYLFCIDADVRVEPDSLPTLVHHLDHNPEYMAVSGQIQVRPAGHSVFDPLQRFWSFVSRHLTMNALTTLGGLTYLDGGFIAYRLQQSTGTRCLIHEDIVYNLSNKRTNTLHTIHMVLLGEEQYITTLLLQHWPSLKLGYVPAALATTVGHGSFQQILYRGRRHLSTRFHNLLDLWPSGAMFKFNLVASLTVVGELFWTLLMPVVTAYLYFELIRSFIVGNIPYLLLPILAGVLLLLHLVHALFSPQTGLLLGLILYLTVGIPIYHVLIPLYSFLTMNHFHWYDSGGNQTRARLHGAFEDKSARPGPLKEIYATQSVEKLTHRASDSGGTLPDQHMFQSLYTELNRMGMPIDMTEGGNRPVSKYRPQSNRMSVLPASPTLPAARMAATPTDYPYSAQPQSQLQSQPRMPPSPPPQSRVQPSPPPQPRMQPSPPPQPRAQPSPHPVPSAFTPEYRHSPQPPPPAFHPHEPQHGSVANYSMLGQPSQSQTGTGVGAGSATGSQIHTYGFEPRGGQDVPPEFNWRDDFINLNLVSLSYMDGLEERATPPLGVARGFPLPAQDADHPEMAQRDSFHSTPVRRSILPPGPHSSYRPTSAMDTTTGHPSDSEPFPRSHSARPMSGSVDHTVPSSDSDASLLRSQAMIREEINFFLKDANLHTVTRREVKEHLLAVFGEDVTYYQAFVAQCIEEFTLTKLAAQDPQLAYTPSGHRGSQAL